MHTGDLFSPKCFEDQERTELNLRPARDVIELYFMSASMYLNIPNL